STVVAVEPPEKKAKEEVADDEEISATGPDTVRLYAWKFEHIEFHEQNALPAVLPADLELLKTWKPDYDSEDGYPDFPVNIFSIYFPHHDELEEDVEGKSHGIAELFAPFLHNIHEFTASRHGVDTPVARLEITVTKRQPKTGPFVNIQLCNAIMDDYNDGFEPVTTGSWAAHILQQQGYSWVTAVDIDRDPVREDTIQLLIQGNLLDLADLYPPPGEKIHPPAAKGESENDELQADEAL
ncbi:hypothetical protein EWM64_g9756, partial [Hericium alpestre]